MTIGSIPHRRPILAWLRATLQDVCLGVDQDALVAATIGPHPEDLVAALLQLGHHGIGNAWLDVQGAALGVAWGSGRPGGADMLDPWGFAGLLDVHAEINE